MNKLFCLVGPSGTGKDSIRKKLGIPHVVSYRTREMREEEVEGVDGKFIRREDFEYRLQKKEWIAMTLYGENYYGITKQELVPLKYTSLVYVIDYEGVETLKTFFQSSSDFEESQIVTIYIDSPYEVLSGRMRTQGRDHDSIEKRMSQYWDVDFLAADKCNYKVYNAQGKLKESIQRVKEIIKEETTSKVKQES
jgi:guanylate kinase